MGKSKLFCVSLFLLLSAGVFSQDKNYSINGEIEFQGDGTVYIYLVDDNLFRTPGVGLQTIIREIQQNNKSDHVLSFNFNNIVSGEYGIRVFIDKNGNGVLDKGAFGPKEPWGMSFKEKRALGKPKFSQISFPVNSDISIKIKVK